MSSGKHAAPPAVPAASVLAAAVAVPVALSAAALAPAGHAVAPAGHVATATLDAKVFQPQPRLLVTRIVSASEQKAYTVVSGDTLSGIAGKYCGSAGKWPSLWTGNKAEVTDPDLIYPGQKLRMTCADLASVQAAVQTAVKVPADPPPAGKVWGKSYGYPNYCGDGDGDGWDVNCQSRGAGTQVSTDTASAVAADPAPAAEVVTSSGSWPGGSFGACVVARESGGNSQVMNSTGHYGLYQFSASTWAEYGGNPASFGNASAGEQEQVFMNAMAQGGGGNWSPYDGC